MHIVMQKTPITKSYSNPPAAFLMVLIPAIAAVYPGLARYVGCEARGGGREREVEGVMVYQSLNRATKQLIKNT